MYTCSYCPRSDFRTLKERDDHIASFHKDKLGSGYFEAQRQTPNGELKAAKHQLDQLKAQKSEEMANTLKIPMSPPPHQEFQPPQGWKKGEDGSFTFEKKIGEYNTPFDSISSVIYGRVTYNHFELLLYKYSKDLTEIAELKEKEAVITARKVSLVIDDDAYIPVSTELHNIRKRIKSLTEDLQPERDVETILEDYFYGEKCSQQNEEWQKKCMELSTKEISRISDNFKNDNSNNKNNDNK